MRRSLVALTAGLLLALAAVLPAAASEMMCDSGRDFGAMHSAEAQNGVLGQDMHPGMHQGFSVCIR